MSASGLGGLFAVVALVGCGSSGSGGTTGTGGSGTTGKAGNTGTAGSSSAGHTGSGGTTGVGGAFTTSVSSGTKLTGLTSAQATQLCSDFENYIDHTFIPTICNAAAAASINGLEAAYSDLTGNPSATDAQLRADCTATDADAGGNNCTGALLDGGVQTRCDTSSIPSTCQSTVGDYTKCTNDRTSNDVQYYASYPSCSTITAASVSAFFAADGGLNVGPPEPTSCAMFDSTCDVNDGGTAAMTNMSPLPLPHRKR